jgi:hypothetical protein
MLPSSRGDNAYPRVRRRDQKEIWDVELQDPLHLANKQESRTSNPLVFSSMTSTNQPNYLSQLVLDSTDMLDPITREGL